MAKRSNPNKKNTRSTEIGPLATTEIHDQYVNYKTSSVVFTTRAWAEKFGRELIRYAQRDDTLRIEPFLYTYGMTRDVWKRLWKVYKELEIAKDEAKDIIGERRLRGGLGFKTERLNPAMVFHVQHQYHEDWKEADDYHDARKTKIAADSAGNTGNQEIHVHMDAIPSTGIVPTKKDNNE